MCEIYDDKYLGECVGRIEDGLVYDDKYHGDCLGRIDGDEVYDDQYHGECVGRIEGNEIYDDKYYGQCVGRVEGNEIYNDRYHGECIGRVEGTSVREGAAALLLLIHGTAASASADSEAQAQDADSEDEPESDHVADDSRSAYSGTRSSSTAGGSAGYAPSSSSSRSSQSLGVTGGGAFGGLIMFLVAIALISERCEGRRRNAEWQLQRKTAFATAAELSPIGAMDSDERLDAWLIGEWTDARGVTVTFEPNHSFSGNGNDPALAGTWTVRRRILEVKNPTGFSYRWAVSVSTDGTTRLEGKAQPPAKWVDRHCCDNSANHAVLVRMGRPRPYISREQGKAKAPGVPERSPSPDDPTNKWQMTWRAPARIVVSLMDRPVPIAIDEMFSRTVKVDAGRNVTDLLNPQGWGADTKACRADSMSTIATSDVELTFFRLPKGVYINYLKELSDVYDQLDLRPDPYALASLNSQDPSFSRTYPNMVQWKSEARPAADRPGIMPIPQLPTEDEYLHLKFRDATGAAGDEANSIYCGSFTLGWSYKSDGVKWWYAGVHK